MTHRVLLSAVLALAGVSCATSALPPLETRPEPIQLASCRVPKSTTSVFCGKYVVFENRAAGAGRRITLDIVVLPATGPKPASDPVFVLVGGPGLGAATLVTGDSDWFTGRSRSERDIVFVDQRGTGRSGRLQCSFGQGSAMQNSFNELFPVDRVRACREMAAQHADVRFYTTPIAMDDLDDIRAALGYRRINLALERGTRARQRDRTGSAYGCA